MYGPAELRGVPTRTCAICMESYSADDDVRHRHGLRAPFCPSCAERLRDARNHLRAYVAFHPDKATGHLRRKSAETLAEWRARSWRYFDYQRPVIVDVTHSLNAWCARECSCRPLLAGHEVVLRVTDAGPDVVLRPPDDGPLEGEVAILTSSFWALLNDHGRFWPCDSSADP